jgi:MFS transporter, YNFM family, putative membrane transport protein
MDSLLPQIAADLHTTVGLAAMVVTAYAVTHGSVQLVIGPLADRFGKYRTVALTCAIGAVLVAICGTVSTLPQLALARLATGAAAGWVIPISMAYVGDVVPHDRLQQILGRFISGTKPPAASWATFLAGATCSSCLPGSSRFRP